MGAPNKRQLAGRKVAKSRLLVNLSSEHGRFVQLFKKPDGSWGRVNAVKCCPTSKKELAELRNPLNWGRNGVLLMEQSEALQPFLKGLEEECAKYPQEPITGSVRNFNTLATEEADQLVQSKCGKSLELDQEKADLGRSQVTETALGKTITLHNLRDYAINFNKQLAMDVRKELKLPVPLDGESFSIILETESAETEAQYQHVAVKHEHGLYGDSGNGHFLSFSNITPGGNAHLRCLPGSHLAKSLGDLDKCSSCWRRFVDVPIPDGYFLVIHPLIIHAGSKTASLLSRVRSIHGYHGWSNEAREAKSELNKVDANMVQLACKASWQWPGKRKWKRKGKGGRPML